MKGGSIIATFAVLFLLLLIGAIAMTVHGVRYEAVEIEELEPPSTPDIPVIPPTVSRLTKPRAVLVLDVSGSMGSVSNPSDPHHVQTDAVLMFYEFFSSLAREALDPEDLPEVAVVLFDKDARILDWGSDGHFLPATADNRETFRAEIIRYLGQRGDSHDPRKGEATDYAAAIEALGSLVTRDASPPAVLFMTDGICAPDVGNVANLATVRAKRCALTRTLIDGLETRRYALGNSPEAGSSPLLWAPILLSVNSETRDHEKAIASMLQGTVSADAWNLSSRLVSCREARELVPVFVEVLARWFNLQSLQVSDGSAFHVPPHTQAYAILVETTRNRSRVNLEQEGGQSISLQGSDRFHAAVVADRTPGNWTVQADAPIGSIRVFARHRYAWSLAVPGSFAMRDQESRPQVDLYLCDIRGGTCGGTQHLDFLPALPETVSGSLVLPTGTRRDFRFARHGDRTGPVYRGTLPISPGDLGTVTVHVDVDPLVRAGLGTSTGSALQRTMDLRPLVRAHLLDWTGRPTGGIRLSNVPALPGWLRHAWEAIGHD